MAETRPSTLGTTGSFWRACQVALAPLGAAAVIGWATLRPVPPVRPLPVWCVLCGGHGALNLLLNLGLFVPWGMAWAFAGRSVAWATGSGLLLSAAIEVVQHLAIAGRHAAVGDVLANGWGAAVGAGLFVARAQLLRPALPRSTQLAAGWTALVLGALAATPALLRPAVRPSDYWGQWAPQENAEFAPWGGRVAAYTVNALPIPYNYVAETAETRARFAKGTVHARAAITTGPPVSPLSAVARLVDYREEVVLLGQWGTDLVLRARLSARDATMRMPYVTLPNALPRAGLVGEVQGGTTHRGWFLAATLAGEPTRRRDVWFSAALGWALLSPFDRPLPPQHERVSALWLVVLTLPIGYWGATARRRAGLMLALAPVLALLVVHTLAGLPPPTLIECAGAVVGAPLGWVARQLSRARAPEPR